MIPNPTFRAAKAIEVFGKSGTELLPLIISDIDELTARAGALGLIISDKDASNATRLGDALDDLFLTLRGIGVQIGASLAEPLADIIDGITEVISYVSRLASKNRDVAKNVALIAAGFVVVGRLSPQPGLRSLLSGSESLPSAPSPRASLEPSDS